MKGPATINQFHIKFKIAEKYLATTLRLVFLAMSKFSVFGVKRIWRVLILAFF